MTRYPLSVSCRSKRLTLSIRFVYAVSDNSLFRLASVISSIHAVSKNTNFPASGIFAKYRYKNGFRSSSSVFFCIDSTLKKRGSMFWIICPILYPLPEVPHPSITTSTGIFCSLIKSCCLASFSFAASRRCFNSSSPGLSNSFHSFNISLPLSYPICFIRKPSRVFPL